MKPSTRWLLVAVAGLLLLLGPSIARYLQTGAPAGAYTPPAIPTAAIAATPIPTATPADAHQVMVEPALLRRGPVIVDLAHYSTLERNRFQPLAAALAAQSIDLRFWLPTVPLDGVESFAEFPDQSDALQAQLADASALVVVSPYFLYNDSEVQVVERFLIDGGRLLVISDPDIEGDAARDTNSLAARFNVVFNEDYLYDTVDNDENFTYYFQGGFFDQAAALTGSRIAFYGGRSIDGAVTPQIQSAGTTLSSLRTGQTSFTTAALGGLLANGTEGRVLALSDFDVLTDPYVARHDNRRLLDFVAAFLAGGERNETIADFPAFLGKRVALLIEGSDPVGAAGLGKAAELQRTLELSGRALELGATAWLTDSAAGGDADLLYVAHYEDAARSTTLLADAGFVLETRLVTPTITVPAAAPPLAAPVTVTPAGSTPTPGATATSAPNAATPAPEFPPMTPAPEVPLTPPAPDSTPLTLTVAPSEAAVQEPAATPDAAPPTSAAAASPDTAAAPAPAITPAATPREESAPAPVAQVDLVRDDGIRLLADETQMYIQRSEANGRKVIAVLGASDSAINAGLTRLLNRDLSGCLIQDDLVICPYTPGESSAATTPPQPAAGGGIVPDAKPASPEADVTSSMILIVDDDRNAVDGDIGEAELYGALLARAGYAPTLWSTAQSGYPEQELLDAFAWVIWSDAAYTESGIRGDALRIIGDLINRGGKITLGSRMPFFGVSADPPSSIADVVVVDGAPALIENLPAEPIALPAGLPDVSPLEREPEPSTGATIALRRGPASAAADAPVLMLYTDANFDEPKGAKLLIFGMSLNWLPDEVAGQLVENMAQVMLE